MVVVIRTPSPPNELTNELVRLIRAYLSTEDSEIRTSLLKQVAERVVDLRACFLTPDGEPDWKGASRTYKNALSSIFSAAGVRDRTNLSAAIRWHVGEVLRSRLSDDELEDAGLLPAGPRQRSVNGRGETRSIVSIVRGGAPGPAPVDPVRALAGAYFLLASIEDNDLVGLAERADSRAEEMLTSIGRETRRLRAARRG